MIDGKHGEHWRWSMLSDTYAGLRNILLSICCLSSSFGAHAGCARARCGALQLSYTDQTQTKPANAQSCSKVEMKLQEVLILHKTLTSTIKLRGADSTCGWYLRHWWYSGSWKSNRPWLRVQSFLYLLYRLYRFTWQIHMLLRWTGDHSEIYQVSEENFYVTLF